ncbi:MAG: NADH-quinone oxidoreductase subunit NuoK [Deferribacterales bacterium]|jgi:NADH-quinone oxidoreductase subunit K|uniref:NADH-quinone oxidoreductase subunit NuoK n=1 Tax=Deferrivibrio essentukiensis TaxID=2880922 RepID=UPI0019BA8B28|nr:NADH-quinone oxidoreductase subunit NuoK [Deferrivibrio essentukiensis]MBC7195625.1 NADH-quinone oxidoreductase subunit NuoK [Deferribacterales bacterium]MBZ4643283.1 nuoK [Deferribacteraceae bacterium]MCB4203689.1 NADH-quinone oxidoreductase subunit NuoK [Deferrivibrio essentukiensis]MDK2792528.1 NADH-quinone oxidoreductase subunit [Deferribacteres bacterium]
MTLQHYLALSAIIFGIGMTGVLVRRNLIVMFMSLELMLNAVNINLAAFSKYLHAMNGQVFIVFVMAVAAAEAAVGLALIITLFKNKETINADEVNFFKG